MNTIVQEQRELIKADYRVKLRVDGVTTIGKLRKLKHNIGNKIWRLAQHMYSDTWTDDRDHRYFVLKCYQEEIRDQIAALKNPPKWIRITQREANDSRIFNSQTGKTTYEDGKLVYWIRNKNGTV